MRQDEARVRESGFFCIDCASTLRRVVIMIIIIKLQQRAFVLIKGRFQVASLRYSRDLGGLPPSSGAISKSNAESAMTNESRRRLKSILIALTHSFPRLIRRERS